MRIKLDINHMMNDFLGGEGLDRAQVAFMEPALKAAYAQVEANRGKGMQGWMDLHYDQGEIVVEIEKKAAQIRKDFDAFVVLGIGGSALGPAAVHQALSHLRYNELPDDKRPGPRLYIEDNIDPERMASLLDVIDVKKTCFNVITKSGGTAETMSQYLIVLDLLKKAVGEDYRRHILITTSKTKGFLIKIAEQEGYETFFIPDGVGGRFSELSPVGLIAASVCGIDIRGLLEGAKAMDEWCKTDDIWKNPALLDAGLMVLSMQAGKNVSVMLPYADSLKLMSDWYAQLWAESLGKNVTLDGKPCAVGQTPVKALGVTDQHSQLQLYTEGPFDKVITFLGVDQYRTVQPIPHGFSDIPAVTFLGGHTLNELIQSEQAATEYALVKSGKLNQTITLPVVNAFTIGQLLYFFEVQTAVCGELLGIDAFDQPGVEAYKKNMFALLGKPGYEALREELLSKLNG